MNASELAEVLGRGRVFELSHRIENGMPRYPSHPEPSIELARRHGDRFRRDGASSASCRLILGGHTGTHVDAIGHVSFRNTIHGGVEYKDAQSSGVLTWGGAEQLPPLIGRCVLFDIPALHGVAFLPPNDTVSVSDLQGAEDRQGTELSPGDIALIRTGWGSLWGEPRFLDNVTPGPDEAAARWLLERGASLMGSDTPVFEKGPVRDEAPVHTLVIWERGVPIIESLQLEYLAAAGVHESVFIGLPLPLVGATGSPIRAVALTSEPPTQPET